MNEKLWCDNCQTWVRRNELKPWSGDDMQHYLCPGCDGDILPPVSIDGAYYEWLEEQDKND